jgi:signal transduction histidine kinase
VLRLRRLALGCALGTAGATAAIALVARLDFAYRTPTLHVALETTAAIAASAAAFLVLGRFRRTGFLDELILSAGLTLLAFSNLAFAALPAAFNLPADRAAVWSMLFTGTLAALLICVAALLPRRRLAAGPRWLAAIYGSTLAVACVGMLLLVVYEGLLPYPVRSSTSAGTSPHLTAHPTVLTLQLFLTLLYLLAALGFARRHRLTGDELSIWLEVACIFSAAARVNYAFHPSLYSDWVYTGDVFRLGFYLALLIGAAREIASYWTSVVAVASLEERRRLARDVHDGLAQEIAFVGRNARLLREQGAEPELVDRILRGIARAQEESRRVIGALSAKADDPLEQALAEAARDAAQRYGAAVDMDLENGIVLSPEEREAVVRIASEAVANAARHSGAEVLRVYLERLDAGMRLGIVDDGAGFDDDGQPRRGFGLVTMKDRAEALGGKLRIDSRRGAGTKVELEL